MNANSFEKQKQRFNWYINSQGKGSIGVIKKLCCIGVTMKEIVIGICSEVLVTVCLLLLRSPQILY